MAGRGPAPKAASRRARTNRVMAERVVPYEPADQPQLPDGVDWPEATIEWWNMWFNAIIHVEPYHNLKSMIGDVEAYSSFERFVDSSLSHAYEYCMAVVSTCCDV